MDSAAKIPLLDEISMAAKPSDGSLVRFRCMIQDNLDKVMKHKRAGTTDLRYRLGVDGDSEAHLSDDFYDVERFIGISVPGKRVGRTVSAREPFEDTGDSDPATRASGASGILTDLDNPPDLIPAAESEATLPHRTSGKSATSPHTLPGHFVDAVTREARVSALINICDSQYDIKLHEVVEIIGIVYTCAAYEDNLPAVDYVIETIAVTKGFQSDHLIKPGPVDIQSARIAIKSVLTKLLQGDETAAEYLLLQLVSARVGASDTGIPLGSWGLNLSGADGVDLSLLSAFIRSCVPDPVISVQASNEVLLNEKFYPHRPIENDFTIPGILQLPSGSLCIIDERPLHEGNVNALNILAISKAVREQELMAIFGSSDVIKFNLDVRFVILNGTAPSSMFSKAEPAYGVLGSCPFVSVLIKPQSDHICKSSDIILADRDMELLRTYIQTTRACLKDVIIPESIIEDFQTEWVEARKADPNIPVEDLDIWATLLRNVAASQGKAEVTREVVEHILQLEADRRHRLSSLSKTQNHGSSKCQSVVTGA